LTAAYGASKNFKGVWGGLANPWNTAAGKDVRAFAGSGCHAERDDLRLTQVGLVLGIRRFSNTFGEFAVRVLSLFFLFMPFWGGGFT
jgi:hypothetical protein